MLVDQQVNLPLPLFLLLRVGNDYSQRDHVLNDQDAELVACAVVQVWLDFDLWHTGVRTKT